MIQAAKSLYTLVVGIPEVPKGVFEVSREARAGEILLSSLKSLSRSMEYQRKLSFCSNPSGKCLDTLAALTDEIKNHVKASGDPKISKWKCLTWAFKRDRAGELCNRLPQRNTTLIIAIGIMKSYV